MNGFLYALRSGDKIKIGFSKNPERRTRALTTASPAPCAYLGSIAGTRHDEGALHRKLWSYRVHGEWFRAEGDVLAFVGTLRPARDFLFNNHTDKRRLPRSPEMQERVKAMLAARRAEKKAYREAAYQKYRDAQARKSVAAA